MNRTILSVAALVAGAAALAGCGAGGSASGTTSGVAGAHHAMGAGSFRASVHGFEARIQTSVDAFQKGNVAKAVTSGGSLLTNCTGIVDHQIAPRASTNAQRQAVTHLRIACSDTSKSANAGASGNMTKAKQFARAALKQTQIAAKLSG